jgi:hypothetical protein
LSAAAGYINSSVEKPKLEVEFHPLGFDIRQRAST